MSVGVGEGVGVCVGGGVGVLGAVWVCECVGVWVWRCWDVRVGCGSAMGSNERTKCPVGTEANQGDLQGT